MKTDIDKVCEELAERIVSNILDGDVDLIHDVGAMLFGEEDEQVGALGTYLSDVIWKDIKSAKPEPDGSEGDV